MRNDAIVCDAPLVEESGSMIQCHQYHDDTTQPIDCCNTVHRALPKPIKFILSRLTRFVCSGLGLASKT